jgi:hypothetical protein
MTLIDILILLAVVGLFIVGTRWVLSLAGIAVPDALIILAAVLIVLLVITGQCDVRLGIEGR